MTPEKEAIIFGQDSTDSNNTIFHIIARTEADGILDRIWNGTEPNQLQTILIAKNNNGDTCLHTAVKNLRGYGAERIMATMFDMGADLDAQDSTGDTVLHIAVKRRDFELVEWLLSLSINQEIKNDDGLTSYELAKLKDDMKMMKVFHNVRIERENFINKTTASVTINDDPLN